MESLVHYTHCPACGSANLHDVFPVRDFTVSKEQFMIVECGQCTLRFTQDIPTAEAIGPYYKSDDYISHTNTSRGIVNRLYLAVRRRTMRRKRNLVQRETGLRRGRLLDIGSGVGTFANTMQRAGWEVTGLEPEDAARQKAKELYDITLQPVEQFFQLPAGSFDAITLWHVLEHVHALENYLRQMEKLLKPTGKLLIAVPNYTSRDASIYREYWAAYDVPRHLYHFSPVAMRTLVERVGLHCEAVRPMWFDSFYISMLSNKYKFGKTKLPLACWNGLRSNLAAFGNTDRCSSVIYVIGKK